MSAEAALTAAFLAAVLVAVVTWQPVARWVDAGRDALRRRTARRAAAELHRRQVAARQAEICRTARAKGALR